MNKKIILISCIMASALYSSGQGWIGNSTTNTLFPVNTGYSTSPLSIGIGTTAPTEQLHTTAGVRFAGLTQMDTLSRIVVQDANGKLYWKYSPSVSGNFWSLTGNAGTVPGVGSGQNFLGTTDNQRLVFGTNAGERMTILTNGYAGIGTATPQSRLHVGAGFMNGITGGTFPELSVSADDNYSSVDGGMLAVVNGGAGAAASYQNKGGRIIFGGRDDSSSKHVATFARINGLKESADQKNYNGFFSIETRLSPGVLYERMRISSKGGVGIATTAPTATLHVKCNPIDNNPSGLRFENLSAGEGYYLVIDDNGYVYKSKMNSNTAAMPASVPAQGNQQAEINQLRSEVEVLKNMVNQLASAADATPVMNHTDYGFSLSPNPFGTSLTLNYQLAEPNATVSCSITDINGKELLHRSLPGKAGKNSPEIIMDRPGSSVVFVTLFVNGEKAGTRKAVALN